jgi:DNA-binding XRE family transcriptional regulator
MAPCQQPADDSGPAAAELGRIHYQTIGHIERGEYAPSLHLALRIAACSDPPVEAILSLEPFERLGATALLARSTGEPDNERTCGGIDARDR